MRNSAAPHRAPLVNLAFELTDGRARDPTRGTPYSVGLDVYACLGAEDGAADEVIIAPGGGRLAIGTGVRMCPPPGTYLRVAGRSSLALNNGIVVGGGVIDPDYRGEIRAILVNTGRKPFSVRHGDKIAQLVLERCVDASQLLLSRVPSLSSTERGTRGFGSTDQHKVRVLRL